MGADHPPQLLWKSTAMSCLCEQLAGSGVALSRVCLGNLWLFEDLPAEQIAALNQQALRRKLSKGAVLFHQGDQAEEMFLLKGGRIKLSKLFEDGGELTLDIRKAGDFVGENMFADEAVYPVSAVCLEDTLTCGFSRHQFEQLITENPRIGLQIIKNLSNRINWLTSRIGNLAVTNIEQRLYEVLTSVAREHGTADPRGVVIQFPLTHEDLSFLTGAHRVSITRAMKALKKSGKIVHRGKQLVLPGP